MDKKQRLKKKREIAKVIRNAEKKGLYEMAEHATSEIDLDVCKFAGSSPLKLVEALAIASKQLARHLEKCDECWKILWDRVGEGLRPSATPRVYAKGVPMPKLSGRKEAKL